MSIIPIVYNFKLSFIQHYLSFPIVCHFPLSIISSCLLSNPLSIILHCLSFPIVYRFKLFFIPHYLSFPIVCHSNCLLSTLYYHSPMFIIPIVYNFTLSFIPCYLSFPIVCHSPLSIILICLFYPTLSIISHCLSFSIVYNFQLSFIPHYLSFPHCLVILHCV